MIEFSTNTYLLHENQTHPKQFLFQSLWEQQLKTKQGEEESVPGLLQDSTSRGKKRHRGTA